MISISRTGYVLPATVKFWIESYRRLSGMIIEVPRSQSSSYTSTILLVGRPLTLTEPREKMSFRSFSPSLTTAR